MRSELEIQRAHDMLIALILREVPNPLSPESIHALRVACDVLCWALEHDHNDTFGRHLAGLEQALASAGFKLEKRDRPTSTATPP